MFAQTTMSEMETPEKIQKTKEDHGKLPSTQNDWENVIAQWESEHSSVGGFSQLDAKCTFAIQSFINESHRDENKQ